MRKSSEPIGGGLVHSLNLYRQPHRKADPAFGGAEVDGGGSHAIAAIDLVLGSHELQCAIEARRILRRIRRRKNPVLEYLMVICVNIYLYLTTFQIQL